MKESKLIKSLVPTFVAIVLGGPTVLLADTPSILESANATVSYADLNLENEEGVRILYRRLKRASEEVCGITPQMILGSRQQAQNCYQESLSNAVDKIDNESLTRIHAG